MQLPDAHQQAANVLNKVLGDAEHPRSYWKTAVVKLDAKTIDQIIKVGTDPKNAGKLAAVVTGKPHRKKGAGRKKGKGAE